MTTATKALRTPQSAEVKKVPAGAAAVSNALQALALMPLHALAEGRNQSIPSLVHELTGLSKARISKGNLDAVRPSTLEKVAEHQQQWLADRFKGDPEALARARQKIATSPLTRCGENALWAGWIHQFEFLTDIPLATSKAVALEVDELVESLLAACGDDDLARFKQVLMNHLECHGHAVRANIESVSKPVPKAELRKWRAVKTWEQAGVLTRHLVDRLYWDLISTLDAEWSRMYFQGVKRMPMFPLMMVRPQDGLIETLKVLSRKNVFFRPTRRLLEFLYALVFFIRYKKWPVKAPSPKVLGDILYRPEDTEMPGGRLISNYFDGSTKLTLDRVLDHWAQMYEHFMPNRSLESRSDPPLPIIVLALQWQALLVQDKGRSVVMPDLENYQALWEHRCQQMEALQAKQNNAWPQTGHPTKKPVEWPAWMLNQPSSSS